MNNLHENTWVEWAFPIPFFLFFASTTFWAKQLARKIVSKLLDTSHTQILHKVNSRRGFHNSVPYPSPLIPHLLCQSKQGLNAILTSLFSLSAYSDLLLKFSQLPTHSSSTSNFARYAARGYMPQLVSG